MSEFRRSVLITGASSGLGKACAAMLDRQGVRVFATVRKDRDYASLLASSCGNLIPIRMDVTDRDSIGQAAELVTNNLNGGGLDGLINNAAIMIAGPLESVPPERLALQFDVNVVGPVATTQAFLPLLRKSRGRIINIGSTSGRVAGPFGGPYAASKFALEAINEVLKLELLACGVRVIMIDPGAVDTDAWDKLRDSIEQSLAEAPPQHRERYARLAAAAERWLGKMSKASSAADDVAAVVVRALWAKRPKHRYTVGALANALSLARFLPPRVRSEVVAAALRIPSATQ